MYCKFVFFLILCSATSAFGQSFEWLSRANFDTISNVGNYHRLIQLCSADDDSMVVTGRAVFSNANLKHIGSCKLTQHFRDTIYVKATIEVNNRRQYDSLWIYFNRYSNNSYTTSNFAGNKINSCKFISRDGNELHAILITTKRKRRSILIVE